MLIGLWVSALVALALRANDGEARAAAAEALAGASDYTGLKYRGVVEGGLLRLAIADRDVDSVRRVLPKVLEAIGSNDADLDQVAFWISPDDSEGVFEALVELWEWQRDESLRDRVSKVLTEVEATQLSWIRKWTRPLLARLRN